MAGDRHRSARPLALRWRAGHAAVAMTPVSVSSPSYCPFGQRSGTNDAWRALRREVPKRAAHGEKGHDGVVGMAEGPQTVDEVLAKPWRTLEEPDELRRRRLCRGDPPSPRRACRAQPHR